MSGRIRTIKPEVLEDEVAAGLSDAAWRLWVSLWVLADDLGDARAGGKYLAAQVWQDTSRDADTPLQELISKGRLLPYAVDGQRYVRINAWTKHQRVDNAGKARMPTPDKDDGTWDQGLSVVFAANRGEPPRVAAKQTETELPAARVRPHAQSGGETPTPISDPDLDPDPPRAVPSEPKSETGIRHRTGGFANPSHDGCDGMAVQAFEAGVHAATKVPVTRIAGGDLGKLLRAFDAHFPAIGTRDTDVRRVSEAFVVAEPEAAGNVHRFAAWLDRGRRTVQEVRDGVPAYDPSPLVGATVVAGVKVDMATGKPVNDGVPRGPGVAAADLPPELRAQLDGIVRPR